MKAFISWLLILGIYHHSVSAQTRIVLDGPGRMDPTRMPLVFVDTFRTTMKHLVINPDQIKSIEIFKDSTAISKFGDAGKYGTIMIHPKDPATFLRVDKIFTDYNISDEDKKLRICINKALIEDPHFILIERSEIVRVEITTDRHWTNIEDANSGEKFINIVIRTKDKLSL